MSGKHDHLNSNGLEDLNNERYR